jgi:predicted MFS family arabinose efflux permease
VWNLGCVVSAILAIFISDSLGRRKTLLLGITLWTVGEIIQTSSYSFAQFIVGRAIAGFGMTLPVIHNLSCDES